MLNSLARRARCSHIREVTRSKTEGSFKVQSHQSSPLQLVRTCARYHQEQKKSEERSNKEKEVHLRHIASTIAREVEFFWSNIEQVC